MSTPEHTSGRTAPTERPDFSQMDDELRQRLQLTPEVAGARLLAMFPGYDDDTINQLHANFRSGISGSHEVRALLRIAEGSEPRLLGEVYWELRDEDGLGNRY